MKWFEPRWAYGQSAVLTCLMHRHLRHADVCDARAAQARTPGEKATHLLARDNAYADASSALIELIQENGGAVVT